MKKIIVYAAERYADAFYADVEKVTYYFSFAFFLYFFIKFLLSLLGSCQMHNEILESGTIVIQDYSLFSNALLCILRSSKSSAKQQKTMSSTSHRRCTRHVFWAFPFYMVAIFANLFIFFAQRIDCSSKKEFVRYETACCAS